MIEPSRHPVIPLLAVLAIGAAGSAYRRTHDPRVDPCRVPEALHLTKAIPGSIPGGEDLDRQEGPIFQWTLGTVDRGGASPFNFRIVRTYGMFERPIAMVHPDLEPFASRTEILETPGGELPVALVESGAQPRHLFVYTQILGNTPVESPILARIRQAIVGPWKGLPLTVLLIEGTITPRTAQRTEEEALRWLTDAWAYYGEVCGV